MIGSFAEKLKNHKDDTDNEFQHYMTLLADKIKYWQWAQTATFIKMLEQIQTKH